jgi:hypothetical protein
MVHSAPHAIAAHIDSHCIGRYAVAVGRRRYFDVYTPCLFFHYKEKLEVCDGCVDTGPGQPDWFEDFLGKRICMEKLENSSFQQNETDSSTHFLSFLAAQQPTPYDGTCYIRATLGLKIMDRDGFLENITAYLHFLEKMGTGHSVEAYMLMPDDATQIDAYFKAILEN